MSLGLDVPALRAALPPAASRSARVLANPGPATDARVTAASMVSYERVIDPPAPGSLGLVLISSTHGAYMTAPTTCLQ